jgi:hypothetical protein
LSEAKAFDNPVKHIGVMTRAAGMLWPRERAQARAVFTEAFELASRHYRERGDEVREEQKRPDSRVRGLMVRLPDQRFVVLRAIARRDAAWARELAGRAADETREEAKKDEAASKERHRPVGEKLLPFAESLLESDRQTALAVARSSFADPASMFLPNFIYKLAESDRTAADAFYREALAAYADRDVLSLLYLSSYPFALTSAIAPVVPNTFGRRPTGFRPDPELQRLFVGVFLNFAGRRLAALPLTVQGKNFSIFSGWPMPNFTLESAFGELGARDFEATLASANQLGDKYLRATAVLALAEKCLEDAERWEKVKKPGAAPKPRATPGKRP